MDLYNVFSFADCGFIAVGCTLEEARRIARENGWADGRCEIQECE